MAEKKKWTVYFDLACMIDVEAETEQEAIDRAKDTASNMEIGFSEGDIGKAHSFRAVERS